MKRNFSEFKGYIRDRKVAVLGIGVSNRPLIKYIAGLGASITACDRKTRGDLGDICSELEEMGVKLRLGEDYLDGLSGFEIILRSPSLRPDTPELLLAGSEGAYVTSEIAEFLRYCPAQVIGVTGSDGKTTTASLIYEMLKEEGYNAWLGGNIGIPLFDKLDDMKDEDKVVLELSSFQLMDMNVSPDTAVITNLSPNHLDIHKSMDEYVESKKNIFKFQSPVSRTVVNLDNDITRAMGGEAQGRVSFFSRMRAVDEGACIEDGNLILLAGGRKQSICTMDEVKLPGLHNIENLLAASAAVGGLCRIESIRKVALTFTGVEHRLEFVREMDGVRFYNDSIASSPTRTCAGLNSFEQKVILIAGGYDKHIPFDELAAAGISKVKLLVLIGVTADRIEDAFIKEMNRTGTRIPIEHASSLEGAVEAAKTGADSGDIVILSPACASFDMFKNFEERGNRFKEIVNGL